MRTEQTNGNQDVVDLYVTFDFTVGSGAGLEVYPCVRFVSLRGEVRGWNAGEFERAPGKRIYGVRIAYTERTVAESGTVHHQIRHELVELPRDATNVQVHVGCMPSVYEQAFDAAV